MKHETRRVRNVVLAAVGLGVGGLLVVGLLGRKDQLVGLNAPIQYDDFRFTVTKAQEIEGAKAGEQRWLVTLSVDNLARRVDFDFKRLMAVLTDEDGHDYQAIDSSEPEDEGELDLLEGPLPAGRTGTTRLLYDVPKTKERVDLRITTGSALGEVLSWLFDGSKRIRLAGAPVLQEGKP